MTDNESLQPPLGFHFSSILICGTAKNVGKNLDDFIKTADTAFSGFRKIEYLICESFSSDDTWERLLCLASSRSDVQCFQDEIIQKSESRRTVRIASARNQLLNHASVTFQKYDYVAMMDLDGVNRDLTKKSVESCWVHHEWDGVTANQPLRYYDIWALRAEDWCVSDCWKEYASFRKTMGHKQALKSAVTSKMRSISRNSPPIQVDSAFGGMAIYKMEAFLSSKYVGEDEQGIEICEHVPFHRGLADNGFKIFVMPSLVNLNPSTQIGNILKELALKLIETIKKLLSPEGAHR
jgi:hypothetical protein